MRWFLGDSWVETGVRVLLVGGAAFAVYEQHWASVAVSVITLLLTFLPDLIERSYDIKLPLSFASAIIIFTYSTLFLGEVGDFYEKYWWWDVLLHGGSAIGFGLIGFIFIFLLFKGDRYAAPPIAMAFFAFCFGVSIGVVWEIFEFVMDQTFGLNMQKSGLVDTMWDLIVDAIGATLGAAAGFFYLKKKWYGGLAAMIDEFVKSNRRLFSKNKD